MKAESSVTATAVVLSASSSAAKDSRRRQYRSCDRCRVGKRACNAEYDSVAEAINNKVACSNCTKKGKTCSFQYVLSILGGVPSVSAQGMVATTDVNAMSAPSKPVAGDKGGDVTRNDAMHDATPARTGGTGSVEMTTWSTSSSLTRSSSRMQQNTPSKRSFVESMTMAAAANASNFLAGLSPTSSTTRMASTIDRIFLNDGLVRIYEGAAEHALQCWITSSNTPYMLSGASSSRNNQQLVYWRICELDRGARMLLSHTSTGPGSREKDIMDAFHSVVLAFAAQWSPRWVSGLADRPHSKTAENKVRLALWERARDRLQKVANVDSFRVIFALIIFAWTEKPRQVLERAASVADVDLNGDNCALDTSAWQSPAEGSTFLLVAAMRKLLSIKFKIEGKKRRGLCPWNAPNGSAAPTAGSATSQGTSMAECKLPRQEEFISELGGVEENSAMTMADKIQSDLESKQPSNASNVKASADAKTVASAAEVSRMEGTYHMLYWLCVVIDTETSVLRKHPPVVCDEDSEIMSSVPGAPPASNFPGQKGIWDDYILDMSRHKQQTEFATSWPCDVTKAAATLAFSTPVKVVMFRQISRLQMSFWRRASTSSVEQQIRNGLAIIYHWNQVYGPLIDSCRSSHASLPASIQSWYVLLAFPWYLAILLFVEMVQTVDMAGASDKQARSERARSGIFPRLRDRACSDLALLIEAIQSTSFTHLEPTFEYVRDSGGNLLLTEPWSEILVHSITTVVKTEVKLHEGYCSSFRWKELEESHSRIEKCLWALDQLSDRSPSASMAYEEMEKLTSATRQGHLAFQQIPMASPPLQRDTFSVAKGGGVGGGPSPASDVDSIPAASSLESSMKGAEVPLMGFGSALDLQQDPLQSALDTHFAMSSDSHNLSTPLTTLTAGDASAHAQISQRPDSCSDEAQKTTDYLRLLQMVEQCNSSQVPMQPQSDLQLDIPASSTTGQPSIEPLSILETLAQLTNQPMRDLLSLSSDSSSSSMDTAFSFDSMLAGEWDIQANAAPALTSTFVANENLTFDSMAQSLSSAATSATSCSSTESDSEASDRASDPHIAPRKRLKSAHFAQLDDMVASTQQPLPCPLNPHANAFYRQYSPAVAGDASAKAALLLGQKYMSVPLQPPPLYHRKHDDLYTDDDDEDLVTYRATLCKRKRSISNSSCDSGDAGQLVSPPEAAV